MTDVLDDYPNAKVLKTALENAFVSVSDEQLFAVLRRLEILGFGIWHYNDLDGG